MNIKALLVLVHDCHGLQWHFETWVLMWPAHEGPTPAAFSPGHHTHFPSFTTGTSKFHYRLHTPLQKSVKINIWVTSDHSNSMGSPYPKSPDSRSSDLKHFQPHSLGDFWIDGLRECTKDFHWIQLMSGHLIALIAVPTFISGSGIITKCTDFAWPNSRTQDLHGSVERRGLKRMTIRQGTGEVAIDEPAKNRNEILCNASAEKHLKKFPRSTINSTIFGWK